VLERLTHKQPELTQRLRGPTQRTQEAEKLTQAYAMANRDEATLKELHCGVSVGKLRAERQTQSRRG